MPTTLRQRLQSAANSVLRPLGLHLARRDRAFEMDGLLARARARGAKPTTVIDVGASDGIWSLRARRHFPDAEYLLFEPLTEHRAALQRLAHRHGFHHVEAVAGDRTTPVAFTVDAGLDGSGVAAAGGESTRTVPQVRIDDAVAARGLRGPYCVKLDTHGYEIPVLEGAPNILAQTELLVIEAYNFALTPNTLRFPELCTWLESRGFRCCDLADPMRRPGDGAFWQMDLAFVPVRHPVFESNRYD